MALSPADFVAYSRATGTPYPEDPEERAQMAPEVAEFRRNQLRRPQEESNLPGIIGASLAGLGVLGAAVAGSRRFGRGTKNLGTPAVNESLIRKAAQGTGSVSTAPSPPLPPTPGTPPSSEGVAPSKSAAIPQSTISLKEYMANTEKKRRAEVYANVAQKSPSELPTVYRPKGGITEDVLITDPNTGEIFMRGRSPQRFAKQYVSTQPEISSQALGALESAEDQMTGRAMLGAQRNEDLDLAEVNSVARQTGDADVALSMTSDGIPVDQVELTQPISAQDLANQAKEEMIARRQSLEAAGLRPGTVRFERALAQPFRTSSNQQVTGTQPIEFALPAGPVRRTVESVGAQDPLIERSVLNIGPQAVVTSTAAGTAIRGASPSYHEAMPKESLRQLYGTADVLVPGAPNEVGPDLPGSLRVRGGVAPDVEPQLLSKQEIVYSVLDRPETLGPAGGSAGIGVYGLEPGFVPGAVSKATGEYSEAASRKPSYVPGWLQKRQSKTGFESLTTPQLAAGAEAAKAPGIKASFESELAKRETTKRSLEASEIARRAIIEGRDPQTILRQRGFNV